MLKLTLENHMEEVVMDSNVWRWMVEPVVDTFGRHKIGEDGVTPCKRTKGCEANAPIAEACENVMRHAAKEVVGERTGTESMWEHFVYLGNLWVSIRYIIGTAFGLLTVRSANRLPIDEHWGVQFINESKVVPWEPVPGRHRHRTPCHDITRRWGRRPGRACGPICPLYGGYRGALGIFARDVKSIAFRVATEDLAKFGCIEYVQRMKRNCSMAHSDECRSRATEEMTIHDDPDSRGNSATETRLREREQANLAILEEEMEEPQAGAVREQSKVRRRKVGLAKSTMAKPRHLESLQDMTVCAQFGQMMYKQCGAQVGNNDVIGCNLEIALQRAQCNTFVADSAR